MKYWRKGKAKGQDGNEGDVKEEMKRVMKGD